MSQKLSYQQRKVNIQTTNIQDKIKYNKYCNESKNNRKIQQTHYYYFSPDLSSFIHTQQTLRPLQSPISVNLFTK